MKMMFGSIDEKRASPNNVMELVCLYIQTLIANAVSPDPKTEINCPAQAIAKVRMPLGAVVPIENQTVQSQQRYLSFHAETRFAVETRFADSRRVNPVSYRLVKQTDDYRQGISF
jgi:hypothetical protein